MPGRIIEDTLLLVRDALETALQNDNPRHEPWVSLSNVVNIDGKAFDGARNKVVMFLANITHETRPGPSPVADPRSGGYVAVPPPMYIDLHLAFFANFEQEYYREGLGLIGEVVSFFQHHMVLTSDDLPGLDVSIQRLTFELQNLDLADLRHLAASTSTRYLPTVVYKVRSIPFDSRMVAPEVPAVRDID